ncbi:unconventional myosin-XVIIIa-like isoform X3 [Apostichopus japonicus]|uniref:unconventional myosin-XVIIIa-like isoform X3 n=1 Tax=Stichopus japonicus TaxID=307972 RepID=UPI003AB15D29
MFSFKKKDKHDKKEKKAKKSGKEKLTDEEMRRLEEIHLQLQAEKKASLSRKDKKHKGDQSISQSSSDYSVGSQTEKDGSLGSAAVNNNDADRDGFFSRKPSKDKKKSKGILKGTSSYGAQELSHGTISPRLDDHGTLTVNTAYNERLVDPPVVVPRYIPEIETTPPVLSPTEKTFDADLQLPVVVPPKPKRAREVKLYRQPGGGFGFTLRRTILEERALPLGILQKREVHFAEPSTATKENTTGLLPGDRLVEVNGTNVQNTPRDEIIGMIRNSGDSVQLKVQPIPELVELSHRSGADGSEVMLDEEILKTGSLVRTASMRMKKRKAKSEEQLASERNWISDKVWLVHKGGFSGATTHSKDLSPDGRVRIKLDTNGQFLDVEEEDLEKANHSNFDRTEDLSSLLHLNDSSILHTLRQRYGANLIHTYAGRNLLIINPTHQLSVYSDKHATAVVQMFRGCKLEDLPPHIYAVGQSAYLSMQTTRRDQSIVFMGKSGSGKSWNVKHVLQYLCLVANPTNTYDNISIEKLNAMLCLMEAFGSARTIQSTNASRCAQVISLDFDYNGQIAAASLQVLLLEKYRVIRRPKDERNFHILYYLMEGADDNLRQELYLNKLGKNDYISPLEDTSDKKFASGSWQRIINACSVLGITKEEIKTLWSVLASVIHLGAAGAVKGQNNAKAQFKDPSEAQKVASLLGVTVEDLVRNIFSPKVGGTPTRGLVLRSSEQDAEGAVEALEGMMVGLYTEAVNALVSLINRALSSTNRTSNSIFIVDIPGFQSPEDCGRKSGASFRDLCDNYANERMFSLYNDHTFTSQQDKYAQENISFDFESSDDIPPDAIIDLIDKQQGLNRSSSHDLRNSDQKGLLWMLDEEAMFPGASDDSFMERLYIHFSDEVSKSSGLMRRSSEEHTFILNHMRSTYGVKYHTVGWIKNCREHPIIRMAGATLQESQKKSISSLFVNSAGSLPNTMVGSVAGIQGSAALKRASSLRRAWTSGTAAIKRKSLCLQIKFQVDGLIDSIRRTNLHFVHCITPHALAGLSTGGLERAQNPRSYSEDLIDVPLLRKQIKSLALLQALRIHKFGFPESILFTEFKNRFGVIAPAESNLENEENEQKVVEEMLKHMDVDGTSFRIGLSQIFFRPGCLIQLEDQRDDKLTSTVVKFQAHIRGYLARKNFKTRQVQNVAIRCIQRNIRKYQGIRNWPWWKLVAKILPLLDVHRTEEELKMKNIEVEELRARLVRVEQERNNLKLNCDKLEARMSELTTDLSEEHDTATNVTEMLEAETAERLRLEKELKDLKASHQNLKRKAEQLDMEVIESRMMRSSFIDGDTSTEEEDSVYKHKYDYLRKESELAKTKLKQEHEEELENLASAKKAVERKLAEALEEVEEQRRQAVSMKRKSVKLNGETQDIRRHLETQQSRNSDLEKKQRKFDTELHKFQSEASTERIAKERMQREKDQMQSEINRLLAELEEVQSEVKFKEDRIEQQKEELEEMSSHGNKEVVEITTMKRQKRELEAKIEDLEEELDDQAGQIQQLTQTKLRLEMQLEKGKQSLQKDLDAKDQEMEDVRISAQNKVKQLELQVEEEYRDRQTAQREKRELERQLAELRDQRVDGDKETEKRLRRDLKRTKALLYDTQTTLEKQQAGAPSHLKLKSLRNDLEDAQLSTAAAVKARQTVENELLEVQAKVEELSRGKMEIEDKLSHANRDKSDLESQLEDNEEEINDLMKKYKASINQAALDQAKLLEANQTISDLRTQLQDIEEKNLELSSRAEFMTNTMIEKNKLDRLESRVKELESRLDLEQTQKQRLEGQIERLKDSQEDAVSDRESHIVKEQRALESVRKSQREVRELREEMVELQRKEADVSRKKEELEKEIQSLEETNTQQQSDLKLAFKRISDLKSALEDNIGSGSDYSGSDTDSESGSDDYVSQGRYRIGSRSSRYSVGSDYKSNQTRRRMYSGDSDRSDYNSSHC